MIHKQNCKNCGKYYEGQGKYFCSWECNKRIDQDRLSGLVGLYLDGDSQKELSKKFDISIYTVNKYLRKNNIKLRSKIDIGKKNGKLCLGRILSQDHKNKISRSLTGRKNTWGNKISKALSGKLKTKEHIEKVRKSNVGKHTGIQNASWRGGPVSSVCKNCKKVFKIKRSLKKRCKFCSYGCHYIWRSINQRGKNNSNWRGGISFEPYPTEFNEQLKEQIRQRDNCICQKCFKTQEESLQKFNRILSIHHIDYNKKNCEKTNLITLCLKCNTKVNSNRDRWQPHFTNLIDLLDWT